MRRMILVPLLIVLAALAIIGGVGYYVYNNYMYYSTDDAQVTGNLVSIAAPAAGQLASLNVKVGDKVTAGQSIGSVTPATASANGATAGSINLTSPINGVIVSTSAVQGQGVTPGLSIAQVTDPSAVTITSYVDEGALNNISTGQQVDVTVDAYNGTSFTGHVQQIVQAAASEFSLLPTQDNASGNFTKVSQRIPIIITLDGNGGKDLVPGMSAETTIHLH
ncbi:MAG TPA: secretion protein HlyD [Ktedonobacter sp.]|nr:secretion protein HlyD [Ktedonobacter sp.]